MNHSTPLQERSHRTSSDPLTRVRAGGIIGWTFLALTLGGGCVPAAAIQQAEREQAISRGHAADPALPAEARDVARDALDAWSTQLELLDGRELPPDVAERLSQRRAGGGQ